MSIIPKLKQPIESLTNLERERALKRLHGEEAELLEEMGQVSDQKAIPTVQEYVKEQNAEEILTKNQDEEALTQASNNKQTYQRYLLVILNRFLKQESIPKKYKLFVESNDQGIVLGIEGTEYSGAFKVIGIPKYDINACKILAVQTGNTIARMEGHFRTNEAGIIIATEAEAKIAMDQEKEKWKNKG